MAWVKQEDDLIVTSENDEQHVQNLHKTLKKFEECGAKFKKSKCVIKQPKIKYFAFGLDNDGIHISPAEEQFLKHRSCNKLFLGLVNYYYRKFIPSHVNTG